MHFVNASASAIPRFSPWPASGWIVCAASPTRTVRALAPSPMYVSACEKRKGKDATVPGWIALTSGGTISASAGGMPASAAVSDENAERLSIPSERSLNASSSWN